jgi:outer membrane lipase/esterase
MRPWEDHFMLNCRVIAKSLLAATALVAFASPAAAQRVDRIVAFGDSYADTGNFFAFVGINPVTTGAYPTGRFSGGTNYIDTLSQILNAPVDNFAIGGALTSQFNTNTGPNLGFPTEYGSFLTGGAGATPFPAVSGTFGENDLLAISIGGNDARIYQTGSVALGIPVGTLAGAPAAGAASAAYATAGLNLLVGAGAPTISYLAGNTANIPEVNYLADPAAAFAVRDAFFHSFDTAMRQTLAGYAVNGVTVHYLDLNLVGQRIQANYAAYGLTGLACPPFAVSTICISDSNAANQFLFYGDQLHLTSAGFAIVARYIATQLQAPLTLQATSDVALDTARQWGRTLTTRMDTGSPRDGDTAEGIKVYIVGDTYSRDVPSDSRADAFDIDSVGATVGAEYGFGNGVAGIAANYSRPKAKFGNDSAKTKTKSYQIGAYAGYGIAGGFGQAYLGYGKDKHDITREGVIDSMSASPDGSHTVAGAKLGYLMPLASFRVGPVAALDYAKAKVDSYTENGDAALTLDVDSLNYSSLTGSAGIEARGDFAGGGVQLRPYIAATVEKDFKGDGRTVFYAQTSAPIIVNHYAYEDRSKKAYGRLAGGASAAILTNVALDVAMSSTFGKKQGEEVSAHVGVKVGF